MRTPYSLPAVSVAPPIAETADDVRARLAAEWERWAHDAEGATGWSDPYPRSTDVSRPTTVTWRLSLHCFPDGTAEGVLLPERERSSTAVLEEHKNDPGRRLLTGAQRSAAVFFGLEAVEAEVWGSLLAQKAEANHERACQRARVAVRRLVRYHSLTRLLTFTNGAEGRGWASRRECLDDVARFIKKHEKHFRARRRQPVPLVVIAERGKTNGRWHAHAAIPSGYPLPYSKIIRKWSRFMEARGWHSTTSTHRFHAGDERGAHRSGFRSARWCARYLVKYMNKGFRSDRGQKGEHRYRVYNCSLPAPFAIQARDVLSILRFLNVSPADVHARLSAGDEGFFRCYSFDVDSLDRPPEGLHGLDLLSARSDAVLLWTYNAYSLWIEAYRHAPKVGLPHRSGSFSKDVLRIA